MTNFTEVAKKMGAGVYVPHLWEGCQRWGIMEPLTQCHLLGQLSVECENFTDVTEDLNYSARRLLEVFEGRNGLRSLEQAQQITAGGATSVAEAIYGRPWGNLPGKLGNKLRGDGGRFYGRGCIQLTGRGNYTAYSQAQYGDDRIVLQPELLARPYDAAMSACWFFKTRKAWNAALADNYALCTSRINTAKLHLDERIAETKRAKRYFGIL